MLPAWNKSYNKWSVQFSSVAQLCPTLCDPMNRSTPGLSVHHHLPEFTQTHIHRVRDDIQPSHPRSSSSPPAPFCLFWCMLLVFWFHSFTCSWLVFPESLVEEIVFSPSYIFASFVKDKVSIRVWIYLQAFYFHWFLFLFLCQYTMVLMTVVL